MARWFAAPILLLLYGTSLAAQTLAQADAALRRAHESVAAKREWPVPPDTPEMRALIKSEWKAEQDWAAAYLALHPRTTRAVVHSQVKAGNGRSAHDHALTFAFAPLGHNAVLVATDDSGIGTVFALVPRGGRLTPIWSVTDTRPPARLANGERLRSWSADCAIGQPKAKADSCRLLAGRIGTLSSGAGGTARFYIDADHVQDMGATSSDQFSLWSWDGTRATPIYVTTFLISAEQPVGLRSYGDRIVLRMKDDWRHFYACGDCNGRQRDLTLRLTPTGAEESGARSIHPELDVIDELVDRVLKKKPAGAIASPQAVAMLRAQVSENIAQMKDPKQADIAPLLGMVMNYRVTHAKRTTQVCFELDSDIADYFTFVGNRITTVTPVKPGSCDGAGSEA